MSKRIKDITTKSHLIISISSYWTTTDFSVLFDSINRLYFYYELYADLILRINQQESEISRGEFFNDLPEIITLRRNFYHFATRILNYPSILKDSNFILSRPNFLLHGLEVSKIRFESPGIVDLLGIGKVLEQIIELFKFYLPNKEKRTQNEILKIEKDKKIIENQILEQELLSKKIENLKGIGFDLGQIQAIIGVEEIIS